VRSGYELACYQLIALYFWILAMCIQPDFRKVLENYMMLAEIATNSLLEAGASTPETQVIRLCGEQLA
jgi:hypothetical protein